MIDESKVMISTLRVLGLLILVLGTILSMWALLNLGFAIAGAGFLVTIFLWSILRVLGRILENQSSRKL